MHGNADEMPAKVGKRHEPLSLAYECFLASSSMPRCFLANSSSLRLPLWPKFDEQQQRKVEEVGGAPRATIFHTEGVVGFVGTPSCFPDPLQHFRCHPKGELRR